MWKQLPMLPDGLPSIRAALDAPSALAASPFDTSSFSEWVAHGNPWHLQAYGEACCYGASHQLSRDNDLLQSSIGAKSGRIINAGGWADMLPLQWAFIEV